MRQIKKYPEWQQQQPEYLDVSILIASFVPRLIRVNFSG